jgi:nitroreductase
MDKNYFVNRRTVRRYTNEAISDEIVTQMLAEASHAPTTGNMQLYSVVTTRTEEGKAKLAPFHFNQPSVMGCNVVLTFCADFNRFVKWCNASNAEPGYDNFQSFMTAVLDTTLFAQQFCTIAEMRGYGCCYLGTTTYNAPQIAEALNLPKRVVPITTITLGVPDGEAPLSDRLPVEAILHKESYCDYTAESVKELYAEKEAREDSKKFVAENNKESLAQVFTDVRYTKQANEHFSKVYLDFIKESLFEM